MLNKIDQILSSRLVKYSGFFLSSVFGTALVLVSMEEHQKNLGIIFFFALLALIVIVAYWLKQPHKETKMFFEKNSELAKCISDLTLEEVVTHPDIKCAVLTDAQKKGKCIIQVSFILIDKSGQLAVIRRNSHALHVKDSLMISFSPFPNRFKEEISLPAIFSREVPEKKNGCCPKFSFLAKITDDDKNYFFFVYNAIYDEIPDLNDPKLQAEIFCEDGEKKSFVKDKDKILGFYKLEDIIRREETGDFIFRFADKQLLGVLFTELSKKI